MEPSSGEPVLWALRGTLAVSPHQRAYGLRGNTNPIQDRAALWAAHLETAQTHLPAPGDPRAPSSLCHGSSLSGKWPLRDVSSAPPKAEGDGLEGQMSPCGCRVPVGRAFACQAAIPRIPIQLCSAPDLSLGTPRRAFLASNPRMEADLTSVVLSQASPPWLFALDSFTKQDWPAPSCGFLDFLGLFGKLVLTF